MIEIHGATDIRARYKDQKDLQSECQRLFNKLSKTRIEQLLSSLTQIDPNATNTNSLVAHLASQATITTIELLEKPETESKVATKLKAPLPIAGLELMRLAEETPEFLDLLQHIVQLRISMANVHTSLHDKSPKKHVPSEAPAHTAVHALGEIAHILMFLPQLREIQRQRRFLINPTEPMGIIHPAIWRPAGQMNFNSGISPFNLLRTPKEF